jgi:uncharacterized membrane protein YdbT with pleckstrin-like domain
MSPEQSQAKDAVTYEARLHWILFAPPLAFFAGGIGLAFFNPLVAIAFLCLSVIGIIGTYWKLLTTRILITPKRVIYRTGYIARRTIEMHKDKIESIDVRQSVLGRLLDFGSITVKGTGGGIEAIPNVVAPFALREHVAALGAAPSPMPGIADAARS